jgi:hypothetical protein
MKNSSLWESRNAGNIWKNGPSSVRPVSPCPLVLVLVSLSPMTPQNQWTMKENWKKSMKLWWNHWNYTSIDPKQTMGIVRVLNVESFVRIFVQNISPGLSNEVHQDTRKNISNSNGWNLQSRAGDRRVGGKWETSRKSKPSSCKSRRQVGDKWETSSKPCN